MPVIHPDLPTTFLTFQLGIRFSPRVLKSRPVAKVAKSRPSSNNSVASTGTSRLQNQNDRLSAWSRPLTGDPPSLSRALPNPSKAFQVCILSGALKHVSHPAH